MKRGDSWILGVGSLFVFFLVLPCRAGFVAYNDLAWTTGQLNDNITHYSRTESGVLTDYVTGSATPVTLTINSGGGGPNMTQGTNAVSGTDAYNVFNGIVDCVGLISYSDTATNLTLMFTGMNAALPYEVVIYGDRDVPDYGVPETQRVTRVEISDVDSFRNDSTPGADFSGAGDSSTVITNGYNNQSGFVARFSGVSPGDDGDMLISVTDAGSPEGVRFYVNAVMLKEVDITTALQPKDLRITEVMYHYPAVTEEEGDKHDFIELRNVGTTNLDLSGMWLNGVDYVFPYGGSSVLTGGQYYVIVPGTNKFWDTYGHTNYNDVYGGRLKDTAETISVRYVVAGETNNLVSVALNDSTTEGWPQKPDGRGYSIVLIDPDRDDDDPANWRASTVANGTPGWEDSEPALPSVVINEIMATNVSTIAKSGTNGIDWVELYNRTNSIVDLSGWRLTDGNSAWIIPAGLSIAAYSNMLIWCDDPATTNIVAGDHLNTGFQLGALGDAVYLFDAETNRVDAVSFGIQVPDMSLGRVADGTTNWTANAPTPGAANVATNMGTLLDLRINEWVANPIVYTYDWLELYNSNPTSAVSLYGLWVSSSGADFADKMTYPHSFVAPASFVQLVRDGNDNADSLEVPFSGSGGSIGLQSEAGAWVDVVSYSAMEADYSMGRLPDGSPNIVTFAKTATGDETTPGRSNLQPEYYGPILNEILAWNRNAVSNSVGLFLDWVEIYNPGTNFDLAGMGLTDNEDRPSKWVFPAGTVLNSNNYLRVWCDDTKPGSTTYGADMNTGYALSALGDEMHLMKWFPESGGFYAVDSVRFGPQVMDGSIGRVGGEWKLLASPTTGAANSAAATLGAPSSLMFNEWFVDAGAGAWDDWFELYNPATQPIELAGLYVSDTALVPYKHRIAELCFIGTNGYVRFWADSNPDAGPDHVDFGLGELEELVLSDTATNRIGHLNDDHLRYDGQNAYVKGRFPDGGSTNNLIVFGYPKNPGFDDTPSPGQSNYRLIDTVVVNEVLTHTDLPLEDAIELYNCGSTNVNIGGWFLSENRDVLKMYRIPTGTIVTAGNYAVFYETDFFENNTLMPFQLDSALGDEVYLSEADPTTEQLTGYMTFAEFGPETNAVSIGRHVTVITLGEYDVRSNVHYVAMSSRTFGAANAYPKIGSVVISEIMYNPPSNGVEYVELHNRTGSDFNLYSVSNDVWWIEDADSVLFTFPPGVKVPANGYLLVVNTADTNQFRTDYNVDAAVPIYGPFGETVNLGNDRDTVALYMPDIPQRPTDPDPGYVPQVLVEQVDYDDGNPDVPMGEQERLWRNLRWADGEGPSLERKTASEYGNDPANWVDWSTNGTPGAASMTDDSRDYDADGMSDIWERYHFETNWIYVTPGGDDEDSPDGMSNALEFVIGSDPRAREDDDDGDGIVDVLEMIDVAFDGSDVVVKLNTVGASGPGYENYNRMYSIEYLTDPRSDYQWEGVPGFTNLIAQDGVFTATQFQAHGVDIVSRFDSFWRYEDSGTDLGSGWRATNYTDSGWGWGMGLHAFPPEESTVEPIGSVLSTNVHWTYYFRRQFDFAGSTNGVSLKLWHYVDDGAVFYLNNQEIHRYLMPGGGISYSTPATVTTNAVLYGPVDVPVSYLREGLNFLAAEVHQSGTNSSDVVFGMRIEALNAEQGAKAYRCKVWLEPK
ncbi:MAG: lamin tail domain-containing protein [Kiritimatiellae bacterium]|nr:lamin tail domain-containing protein [Kiritimatiellia bacterium]